MNNESKYAQKQKSGRQLYGPGCCAHTVTDSQVMKAKEGARRRGHFGREAFRPEPQIYQDGNYTT